MSHVYRQFLRFATIALLLGVVALIAAAQSPEKPKKAKQSGWIGVMILDVNEELKEDQGLKSDEGAFIEEVVKKSPADSAGLTNGDVVIVFAGNDVRNAGDLTEAVQKTPAGTKTSVTVIRKGEKKTLDITVGKTKMMERVAIVGPSIQNFSAPRRIHEPSPDVESQFRVFVQHGTLGMEVRELNEQLAEYFGAPEGEGVLVESVEKESAAAKAGFKAGDVILRAGKKMVDEVEDIRKVLRKQNDGDKLDFEVLRKGSKKVLTVTIEEGSEGENGNALQFWHQSPGPEMKQFNIEIDRLNEDMHKHQQERQKNIQKKIRI